MLRLELDDSNDVAARAFRKKICAKINWLSMILCHCALQKVTFYWPKFVGQYASCRRFLIFSNPLTTYLGLEDWTGAGAGRGISVGWDGVIGPELVELPIPGK